MTRIALAAVIVFAAAACGDGGGSPQPSAASQGTSGVRGVAVVDAGCPVLEHASTCPQVPMRARIVAMRAGSAERAGAVETGSDGAFQMVLPPGSYDVRGENLTGAPYPAAMPVPVSVRANEFAAVTVVFDSGVRGPGT